TPSWRATGPSSPRGSGRSTDDRVRRQAPPVVGAGVDHPVGAELRAAPPRGGQPGRAPARTRGDRGSGSTTRRTARPERPLVVQYLRWVADVLRGDFGTSYFQNADVLPTMWSHFVVTLELSLLAFVIAVVVGITTGTISAI